MKTLQNCYELNFSKITFIERKIKITHPKTIITGASKTGKSYLIYDFLSNFKPKDYIYIDIQDSRNVIEEIKNDIATFLRQNQIKVLVLENFSFEFDLPYCDNIIISTKRPRIIRGFKNITVSALDFEEYLLHDNRHQNILQSFNNFFKYGNLAEIINIEDHKKIQRLQEIIELQVENETQFEILKLCFENIDEKKSLYQLFNILKNKIKISKDKFYETCKLFENTKTIYFVEKYNQEKANKKIYSYNHSFLNSITYNKKFKNEFTNMIFLELIDKYKNIYYLDNIDFYIKTKDIAIVGIPFFNTLLVNSTLKKIYKIMEEYKIKELFIITISNDERIIHDKFKINVMPFYEWSLS